MRLIKTFRPFFVNSALMANLRSGIDLSFLVSLHNDSGDALDDVVDKITDILVKDFNI